MGLLDERPRVADDPRQQPGHRLDDREDGHLAAVEDVVPEGDDRDPHPRGGVQLHPLVDALVTAAGKDEPLLGGELARPGLRERHTPGARDDEVRARSTVGAGQDLVEGRPPRFGLHDHAGAAAVGGAVDAAVSVVGVLAQVVDPHVQQALVPGLADE